MARPKYNKDGINVPWELARDKGLTINESAVITLLSNLSVWKKRTRDPSDSSRFWANGQFLVELSRGLISSPRVAQKTIASLAKKGLVETHHSTSGAKMYSKLSPLCERYLQGDFKKSPYKNDEVSDRESANGLDAVSSDKSANTLDAVPDSESANTLDAVPRGKNPKSANTLDAKARTICPKSANRSFAIQIEGKDRSIKDRSKKGGSPQKPTQKPTEKNPEKISEKDRKTKPVKQPKLETPEGMTLQQVADIVEHRKNLSKKLRTTQRSLNTIYNGMTEAVQKFGATYDDCIGLMELNGWQSFRADWYGNYISKNSPSNTRGRETTQSKNAQAFEDFREKARDATNQSPANPSDVVATQSPIGLNEHQLELVPDDLPFFPANDAPEPVDPAKAVQDELDKKLGIKRT